jgi:hypothetical protein
MSEGRVATLATAPSHECGLGLTLEEAAQPREDLVLDARLGVEAQVVDAEDGARDAARAVRREDRSRDE